MDWQFLYVLPNLVLPEKPKANDPGHWPEGLTLGTDALAVVSCSDPRVVELRKNVRAVRQILDSFKTEHGTQHAPAVLLAKATAPKKVRLNPDAIVAFRNAIAISVVLKARTAVARGVGGNTPSWSDTFDFHPAQVSGTGHVVLQSPALRMGVMTEKSLVLTASPYVHADESRIWPDGYLYHSLGAEWRRHYVRGSAGGQFGRSLFRSLEVAYSALSVGAKNEGSITDYGLQIALWVSAIEILAWPARKHANYQNVVDLLAKYPLHPALRTKRYRVMLRAKGKPERMDALQRAYTYLYASRNKFLHGNPVTRSALFTASRQSAPIPRLAAVVYRLALAAYLDPRHPIRPSDFDQRLESLFEGAAYDEALAELFGVVIPT